MATPNPETSEIRRKGRQRLIGAFTIVLLAVVFVPMLLDPEPRKDRKEPVLSIPSKEGMAPLPAPAAPKAADAAKPVEPPRPGEPPKAAEAPKVAAVAPKAAEFKSAAKADKPPVKAEAKPAEPKAPVAPQPAAVPKLEGFAIQVGAFGDEEKLKQAREKLAAAKITHFIERLPTGLTRLRAGPYGTREAAEKALPALKAAGLDGKVVPLP
jgi:DedD protein